MGSGGTHNVDHGRQEVDEDGDKDDDVAGGGGLIDPAAGLAQHQRQTLVVLCRGDQDQAAVEEDQHRELDHHGDRPAWTHTNKDMDKHGTRFFVNPTIYAYRAL